MRVSLDVCYWKVWGRYPVNVSVGVREISVGRRGALAAYETKMLNDAAKVESLELERTTGE
jgi:hypothetical protein